MALDENLKILVKEVREDRKTHERCYTAQDKYDIPKILQQVIDEKIYLKDYENVTEKVLFEDVSYEKAITAIEKIIDSKIFEK